MSFGRRQPLPHTLQPPRLQQPAASQNPQHCANAATEIVAMLLNAYTVHGRLQTAAAIAAAAALTGEFALRSSGVPIPEKGMVLGDASHDVLFAGAPHGRPTVWMFISHAATDAGLTEPDLPPIGALAASLARAPGAVLPRLSVPDEYVPRELPMNVGPRFRHRILATADTHDLSLREITIALGAATGQLIIRLQHEIPPQVAATLAAETMLATAQRVPLME